MPPFVSGRSAWHGDTEVAEKFVPILNDAGIDLMISGHTHRYSFIEKNSGENNFPIIVLSNSCRMDLSVDSSGIRTIITGMDKKVISELAFE